MSVIYVGVDRDEYRPAAEVARDPRPTLLALGRIRKYKRLDLVIDAVAELGRTVSPGLRLIVAGDGNHLSALRRHAERTGASAFVEFRGRVSEEEKVELYRQAWAMIMTSPKEGWGLTCLEAQSCGTPVIASDSPGLREAVRADESGLLVPHGDRKALRAAIERFLSDAALRERLAQGALRFAATFSWERAASETLELMESTIAGGVQ
jgi:glycosyltransferase involved in cell wall biosynthesis